MASDLFSDTPHVFTLAQMVACVEREIAQRRSVYPRLISDAKMSQKKADHEIAAMSAVLANLKAQVDDGK
jgi:hypothetical protein